MLERQAGSFGNLHSGANRASQMYNVPSAVVCSHFDLCRKASFSAITNLLLDEMRFKSLSPVNDAWTVQNGQVCKSTILLELHLTQIFTHFYFLQVKLVFELQCLV